MRITKRSVARFMLAVLAGVLTLLGLSLILVFITVWYVNMSMPSGYWQAYAIQMIVVGIPMYIVGCSVSTMAYAILFKPKWDHETRCRRCGYILRGLSRLACPECGEVI